MNKITKEHEGKRLLVTDRYCKIERTEIEVLEVSPSGENVKVKNVGAGTIYWKETDKWVIIEDLPKGVGWVGSAGDELIALLKERGITA